jgi:thiamine biosynthesis lipoprotein ApbE
MSQSTPRKKPQQPQSADKKIKSHFDHIAERQRNMATRSTLSRLRKRKSDLK